MANFKDAATLQNFVQGQANQVERIASIQATEGITYPQMVPVDTSGSPFMPGVTFTSVEQAGAAEFMNGNADDVPMADASLSATVAPVFDAGIGYGYGFVEANQSQLYGINIIQERALAARRAYEIKLENVVYTGDSARGMVGFSGISSTQGNAVTGKTKWVQGTTGAADVAKDLVDIVNSTGQGNVPTANRILIEEDQFTIADTTFFDGTGTTGLDYVRRKYPGMVIQSVSGLKSSSKPLIIAYRNSQDVLALKLPMPHRFLPVQALQLRFQVPGIFRTAGLNFKRKSDIAFAALG